MTTESKYRILTVAAKKDSAYGNLYKYLLDENGEPLEFKTYQALDSYVESMLNDGGYAKSDFIIVKNIDYKVHATIDEFDFSIVPYKGKYDGKEHNGEVNVNKIDSHILYSEDGYEPWSSNPITLKDVGTKIVYVKAENYEYEPIIDSFEIEITKAPLVGKFDREEYEISESDVNDSEKLKELCHYHFTGWVDGENDDSQPEYRVGRVETDETNGKLTVTIIDDKYKDSKNYETNLGEAKYKIIE